MPAPSITQPIPPPSADDLIDAPGAGDLPRGKPLPTAEALRRSSALAAWWHLARSYHCLFQRFTQYLDDFGLTGAQLGVLRSLGEAGPEGLMLSALSKRLMVTCGNITGVVDGMEKDGLLRRERCLEDRRVIRARLTPAGEALYREAVPAIRGYIEETFAGIGDEEKWRLAGLCEALNQTLGITEERGR